MDEKLIKVIDDIYADLTEEQKAGVKACTDTEELMAFISKEGMELPDDVLDAVAGGFPYSCRQDCDNKC